MRRVFRSDMQTKRSSSHASPAAAHNAIKSRVSHPSSSSTSFTILSFSPNGLGERRELFRRCFRRLGIAEGTKNRADSGSGRRRWRGRGAMEAGLWRCAAMNANDIAVSRGSPSSAFKRRKIPSQRAKRKSTPWRRGRAWSSSQQPAAVERGIKCVADTKVQL